MFGIKKKLYYSLTIVLSIIGICLLLLTILGVFKDKSLMYLTVVAVFLGAIASLITPSSKQMKAVESCCSEMRSKLYGALETEPKDFNEVILLEKNNTLELKVNDNVKLEYLNYQESLYIFKRLIKDYVIILYSEMNGNKINMKKALIPNFKIVIERENGEIEEILIVKNYEIL